MMRMRYLKDFRILPWAFVRPKATSFTVASATKELWQFTGKKQWM